AQDDNRDCSLKMEDILPNEPTHPISHDSLIILLETVECEMERVVNAASEMSGRGNSNIMPSLQPERVGQAVKAICALMGNVETMDITEAVEGFKTACLQFTTPVIYD
ncbi:unnamed protein product, partial [Timema podura]|nr:unnamed protein product [Timema podura]